MKDRKGRRRMLEFRSRPRSDPSGDPDRIRDRIDRFRKGAAKTGEASEEEYPER